MVGESIQSNHIRPFRNTGANGSGFLYRVYLGLAGAAYDHLRAVVPPGGRKDLRSVIAGTPMYAAISRSSAWTWRRPG